MTSEIYKSKNIHFPNLDGLRFLAFFVVFINHVVATMGHKTTNEFISKIKTEYLLNGDLGVNFFFVLSGFLVSNLLFQEYQKTGSIKPLRFLARTQALRPGQALLRAKRGGALPVVAV